MRSCPRAPRCGASYTHITNISQKFDLSSKLSRLLKVTLHGAIVHQRQQRLMYSFECSPNKKVEQQLSVMAIKPKHSKGTEDSFSSLCIRCTSVNGIIYGSIASRLIWHTYAYKKNTQTLSDKAFLPPV